MNINRNDLPALDSRVNRSESRNVQWGEVGQAVRGALAEVNEVQSKDFKTQKPEFWDSGEPKMIKVAKLVVTNVAGGIRASNEVVEPGDIVSVWIRGGIIRAWNEALPHGGVKLGDVVTARFAESVPNKNPVLNARKVIAFKVEVPGEAERGAAEQAIQMYRQSTPTMDVPAARTGDFARGVKEFAPGSKGEDEYWDNWGKPEPESVHIPEPQRDPQYAPEMERRASRRGRG